MTVFVPDTTGSLPPGRCHIKLLEERHGRRRYFNFHEALRFKHGPGTSKVWLDADVTCLELLLPLGVAEQELPTDRWADLYGITEGIEVTSGSAGVFLLHEHPDRPHFPRERFFIHRLAYPLFVQRWQELATRVRLINPYPEPPMARTGTPTTPSVEWPGGYTGRHGWHTRV